MPSTNSGKIPLSSPDITEDEIVAVVEVLRGSRLSLGPMLEQFEQLFADYIGLPHAVAVNSGTSGLHLCIRALNIGVGDEVIVPSFTFIAAANAIRYEGATPVFVDIEPRTMNIDPAAIEDAITPKTRAILVVHTFGCPAGMAAILEIVHRHGLLLIEDSCEALGAEYGRRKIGSLGDAAVFGFYPNKQITTGEGGMVVTRDSSLASRMRALRNQGRYDTDDWFQHSELGYNYRLSEINCALGIEQLKRIDEILTMRETAARSYHQHLCRHPDLIVPLIEMPGRRISWFVYVLRLNTSYSAADRDALAQHLLSSGIGCGRYFAPIHLQPAYAAWRETSRLPITESHAARTLALPFFNRIRPQEIECVCETLLEFLKRHDRSRANSHAGKREEE
ncbi:MAG: DegT/DnrJ/EryC1/StrS family aminotransferase [Acidobacteria bacterium]|nr:DegT/DnrJ/EryC1/StrS family aminotransferase [Acidobacteriota bacterium]MBW4044658.1 DegT/DnrJ/EryC1/StrS family aminotransferase [Acidobacteriota bacterium]